MKEQENKITRQQDRKITREQNNLVSLSTCFLVNLLPCFLVCLLFAVGFSGCQEEKKSEKEGEFARLRERMVTTQLEARGIRDKRVLEAMREVPRHKFVLPQYHSQAYEDHPLPIGEGQTISQPYIVALMTECLQLKGWEKVLEIGTGSGYQAAVLAELCKEVYTIEILEPLAKRAEETLKNLGYQNIKVKCGDGYLGWPEYASFDGIIVTCAPEKVPPPLVEQLKKGGRLVIPVGTYFQNLKVIEKRRFRIVTHNILPVRFVPMTGNGIKK